MFHAVVNFPFLQLAMEINFVVHCVNEQANLSRAISKSK